VGAPRCWSAVGGGLASARMTDGWEIASVVGQVAGAAAAAVAAWAAMRAANASLQTSRDASEALALGIRPHARGDVWVDVEPDRSGPYPGHVTVSCAAWPATDLMLELHLHGGSQQRWTREKLGVTYHVVDAADSVDNWRFDYPQLQADGEGRPAATAGDYEKAVFIAEQQAQFRERMLAHIVEVVLTYSDERSLARYEARQRLGIDDNPITRRLR
jgi:hypothetical protein